MKVKVKVTSKKKTTSMIRKIKYYLEDKDLTERFEICSKYINSIVGNFGISNTLKAMSIGASTKKQAKWCYKKDWWMHHMSENQGAKAPNVERWGRTIICSLWSRYQWIPWVHSQRMRMDSLLSSSSWTISVTLSDFIQREPQRQKILLVIWSIR